MSTAPVVVPTANFSFSGWMRRRTQIHYYTCVIATMNANLHTEQTRNRPIHAPTSNQIGIHQRWNTSFKMRMVALFVTQPREQDILRAYDIHRLRALDLPLKARGTRWKWGRNEKGGLTQTKISSPSNVIVRTLHPFGPIHHSITAIQSCLQVSKD